jgi:hypothetical protein
VAVRPLARSLRRDAAALRSRVTWRPPRVPARRLLVGLLAFVVGLIFGPTPPALVAGLRAGAQTPPAQAEQPATSHATADPEPVTVPTSAIAADSDVLVVGTPSEDGYLLEVSAAETGWQPQPLAALTTGPVDTRAWIGYECTTGDGRFVVAVVAPWEATNRPELRDHGAIAFGVEIRTRKVTRLADGVALKHFNPGCGEHTAGLVRHKGVDQARSTVLVVDPASGEVVSDVDLDGQVVGAVPADGTTFVFRDQSVARLDDDGDEVDAQPTGGQPYMAAASPGGGPRCGGWRTATSRRWARSRSAR